jgi:hypothetical protein
MRPIDRFEWAVRGLLVAVVVHVPVVWADQATIYQCKDKNGAVIFSGTPCGPNAKARVIDAPNAGTGGTSARQGIDELAKQYDKRQEQASKNAAEVARAEAEARAAEQARAAQQTVPPPPLIENGYAYGGYPLPGGYYGPGSAQFGGSINSRGEWSIGGRVGGYERDRRRPHLHSPSPYKPPESPGISGRFPGGLPGMRQ